MGKTRYMGAAISRRSAALPCVIQYRAAFKNEYGAHLVERKEGERLGVFNQLDRSGYFNCDVIIGAICLIDGEVFIEVTFRRGIFTHPSMVGQKYLYPHSEVYYRLEVAGATVRPIT